MALHTHIHRLTRHLLEPAQDVLVLAIGLALFGLMGRTVIWLVREIFKPTLEFRQIIAEVLFILVMVEVVRLLIIYLEEHRVAVDFMVELGIVATLREIVLRGVTELAWQQVAALTAFLLALGALLRFGDLRRFEAPGSSQCPLSSVVTRRLRVYSGAPGAETILWRMRYGSVNEHNGWKSLLPYKRFVGFRPGLEGSGIVFRTEQL